MRVIKRRFEVNKSDVPMLAMLRFPFELFFCKLTAFSEVAGKDAKIRDGTLPCREASLRFMKWSIFF